MGFIPNWSGWDAEERARAAGSTPGDLQAAQRERYVGFITQLVESNLTTGRGVLFVTQPYAGEPHRVQQAMIRTALGRFERFERFRYVNLGEAVDLTDPAVAFDGLHLTPPANERIAAELVVPVEDVAPGFVEHAS